MVLSEGKLYGGLCKALSFRLIAAAVTFFLSRSHSSTHDRIVATRQMRSSLSPFLASAFRAISSLIALYCRLEEFLGSPGVAAIAPIQKAA